MFLKLQLLGDCGLWWWWCLGCCLWRQRQARGLVSTGDAPWCPARWGCARGASGRRLKHRRAAGKRTAGRLMPHLQDPTSAALGAERAEREARGQSPPSKRGSIYRNLRAEARLRGCWFRGAACRNQKNALVIRRQPRTQHHRHRAKRTTTRPTSPRPRRPISCHNAIVIPRHLVDFHVFSVNSALFRELRAGRRTPRVFCEFYTFSMKSTISL